MKLLILGAGGHGQVVREIAESLKNEAGEPLYEEIAFLDDNNPKAIGKFSDLGKFRNAYDAAFAAIGNDAFRMKLIENIEREGYKLPILVHEKAYVSPSAVLGPGTVVEPMAVVNTEAVIGKGGIVSIGALVDHNTVIEECVHVSCGTTVKADCYIKVCQTLRSGDVITKEMYGKDTIV